MLVPCFFFIVSVIKIYILFIDLIMYTHIKCDNCSKISNCLLLACYWFEHQKRIKKNLSTSYWTALLRRSLFLCLIICFFAIEYYRTSRFATYNSHKHVIWNRHSYILITHYIYFLTDAMISKLTLLGMIFYTWFIGIRHSSSESVRWFVVNKSVCWCFIVNFSIRHPLWNPSDDFIRGDISHDWFY